MNGSLSMTTGAVPAIGATMSLSELKWECKALPDCRLLTPLLPGTQVLNRTRFGKEGLLFSWGAKLLNASCAQPGVRGAGTKERVEEGHEGSRVMAFDDRQLHKPCARCSQAALLARLPISPPDLLTPPELCVFAWLPSHH